MRTGNPFSLNFGMRPTSSISRHQQTDEVIRTFSSDPSPSHLFMVTGVRGTGKTVFLSEIENYFKQEKWVVCDLSIESDLLQSLASKLYNTDGLYPLFRNAKLNLSFWGIGLEIAGVPPITDLGTAIERMMAVLRKHKRKVLIAIDEATNSPNMRRFASEFQILLRNDYPVYLLMTGLYENLYNLQNEKTLTFLYRAPKIFLPPLNGRAVMESYRHIFQNSEEEARTMAVLTKGYSYAYQVTGYLCWEAGKGTVTEDIVRQFDIIMEEYAYSKIWEEQSPGKRKVLKAIAEADTDSVTEIRKALGMKPSAFSVYRERLIRQGLIHPEGYGKVSLTLPRFDVFIRNRIYDEL